MNKEGIQKIKKIASEVISYVLLILLCLTAGLLLFFIISSNMAKKGGYKPPMGLYTIVSPSMVPEINVYDVVLEFRPTESELKVGDIITFYSSVIDTGGYTITHRIHAIYEENGVKHYITKGDNNTDIDDGDITFNDIVGKVEYIIPKMGKVQFFLSSKYGWILVVLIPALGIIIADVRKLFKIFKIKNQIEEIPEQKKFNIIREKEEDKKLRALVEEADKLNSK